MMGAAAGCSSGRSAPADALYIGDDVSEYQQTLLLDGVTFGEYERATLAAMQCLEDLGVRTFGPYPEDGGRFLSFDYGDFAPDTPEAVLTEADLAADSCIEEFLAVVAATYSDANRPTASELAEINASRRACVADRGFTEIPADEAGLIRLILEYPDLAGCLEPGG